MLYEDYMVTDCGIRDGNNQKVYFCELVGHNSHKISFSLIIKGCVGEKEYNARYEAVAPHIRVSDLLHCEFAWQWHGFYLNLCLAGLLKARARRVGSSGLGDRVSPEDYLNPNRGYWVTTETYGEWIRFPGLISCGGDSCVHTNFQEGAYPQYSSYHTDSAKGKLVWKPKPASQGSVGRIRKVMERLIPTFSRA